MKHVIQSRTYLFKNRNTCCILICCLFGIIKLFKFEITFIQLLKTFESIYPDLIQRTKYDIVMKIDEIVTGFDQDRGNIIEFYNHIFVIANNEYLVQIKNNIFFFKFLKNVLHIRFARSQEYFVSVTPDPGQADDSEQYYRGGQANTLHHPVDLLSFLDCSEESEKSSSKGITPRSSVSSPRPIILNDEKSLHNTEEQVKDMLANMAARSPQRIAPTASPSTPTLNRPFSQTSPNIMISYTLNPPHGDIRYELG